jgi:hypothetical protein
MEVLLARSELLTLSGSGYQTMAIKLIEDGKECDALHELAWEPITSNAEAFVLFESAAQQLGISKPSREEAVNTLLRYYSTRIAAESSTPHAELECMMQEVYWPEVSKYQSSVFVGDSHDMEEFIGAYWNYDDLRDSPDVVGYNGLFGQTAIQAFDQHVRTLAEQWLMRHVAPVLPSHSNPS